MKTSAYQTDAQLQQQALQILSRELDVTNFIRFIQHYEQGEGDYTHDRERWQSSYSVDSLADAIDAWKQA
ncbi:MAG: hypothetical protein K9L82_03055 [Chromatiaceae bacterium]|nr:hypothetical protein [Chromatiaceae bacterium]MCF7996826.1 hypothetical protein [Chromatiaceae bacterium]